MLKQTDGAETKAAPAEELVRAVAAGSRAQLPGDDGGQESLLERLKARTLAPGRKLMTEEEVDELAIRGRFEDQRRKTLDAAQTVVDALRRNGLVTRSIYLVREMVLGRKQIEAAFVAGLKPGSRVAVLAPVPMAGNAKVSEVANIRRLSAASLLKLSYDDGWQVFILTTDGRLNDREIPIAAPRRGFRERKRPAFWPAVLTPAGR